MFKFRAFVESILNEGLKRLEEISLDRYAKYQAYLNNQIFKAQDQDRLAQYGINKQLSNYIHRIDSRTYEDLLDRGAYEVAKPELMDELYKIYADPTLADSFQYAKAKSKNPTDKDYIFLGKLISLI